MYPSGHRTGHRSAQRYHEFLNFPIGASSPDPAFLQSRTRQAGPRLSSLRISVLINTVPAGEVWTSAVRMGRPTDLFFVSVSAIAGLSGGENCQYTFKQALYCISLPAPDPLSPPFSGPFPPPNTLSVDPQVVRRACPVQKWSSATGRVRISLAGTVHYDEIKKRKSIFALGFWSGLECLSSD